MANRRGLTPHQVAGNIKRALGDASQKEAAAILGISPQYMCDILQARRALSVDVAVRLNLIGLDGLGLLMDQTVHEYDKAAIKDKGASNG